MADPWSPAAAQPWSPAAKPKAAPAQPAATATVAGTAGQGARGVGDTVTSVAGQAYRALNPGEEMLSQASNATDRIASLLQSAFGPATPAPSASPPVDPVTHAMRDTQSVVSRPTVFSEAIQNSPLGAWLAQQPQNVQERYARTFGRFLPAAAFGPEAGAGAVPQVAMRTANVAVPAILSEGAGHAVETAGGTPEQADLARVGGGLVGAAAVSAGGALSAGARSAARGPAGTMSRRVATNPDAMATKAAQMRQAGVTPTLVDVADEAGRGVIQAAASRSGPGRELAQNFARGRRLDLPDRMSAQARRSISNDPRTPDQIRADLTAQRTAEGNAQFGAVRSTPIQMAPETVSALRTPLARNAISEAAMRERDPNVRAALNRLAGDALDDPSTPITIGMADRISRVLLGKAQAAAKSGDRDLADSFKTLGLGIRTPAAAVSEGYRAALQNFAARSRLIEAAKVGESFLSRNTDEFTAALAAMSPEERAVAQAAARRAVERASGENLGTAPSVAERLAHAPEQQARNTALLGDQGAARLQAGMDAEHQAFQNAQQINPRGGSPTNIRGVDQAVAEGAGNAARIGGKAARGDFLGATWDAAHLWLKSRGMSDAQAEALVRAATDPTQTNALIGQLRDQIGNRSAAQFMSRFRRQLVRGAALNAAITRSSGSPSPTDRRLLQGP